MSGGAGRNIGRHDRSERKRLRDSDPTSPTNTASFLPLEFTYKWPAFLVMEPTSGYSSAISKLGPFTTANTLDKLAGSAIIKATLLRSGSLLIHTRSKIQSDALQKVDNFAGIPVKISPHNTLNSSKGIIRCRSLDDCAEEEILDNLQEQGIIAVRRLNSMKQGQLQSTPLIILTFDTPKLPLNIKVGYEIIPVDTYIPQPLRCQKCQKYGHHVSKCNPRKAVTCPNCGEEGHTSNRDHPCTNTTKCVNCNGTHPTYDRSCPVWNTEKQILTIKYTQNISFVEARKRAQQPPSRLSTPSTSFAQAAVSKPSPTMKSTATQCDDLIPNIPPLKLLAPANSNSQNLQTRSTSTKNIHHSHAEPKQTKPNEVKHRAPTQTGASSSRQEETLAATQQLENILVDIDQVHRPKTTTKNRFDILDTDNMDTEEEEQIDLQTPPERGKNNQHH